MHSFHFWQRDIKINYFKSYFKENAIYIKDWSWNFPEFMDTWLSLYISVSWHSDKLLGLVHSSLGIWCIQLLPVELHASQECIVFILKSFDVGCSYNLYKLFMQIYEILMARVLLFWSKWSLLLWEKPVSGSWYKINVELGQMWWLRDWLKIIKFWMNFEFS